MRGSLIASCLRKSPTLARLAFFILMVMALPVSIIPDLPRVMPLEEMFDNFERKGFSYDMASLQWGTSPHYVMGMQAGYLYALRNMPVINPKPSPPPILTRRFRCGLQGWDFNDSSWVGSLRFWLGGVGTVTHGVTVSPDWTASTGVVLPFWPVSLLFAFLMVRRIFRYLRVRNRVVSRLCMVCSYDLRAHHPGNKCPECGTLNPAAFTSARSP